MNAGKMVRIVAVAAVLLTGGMAMAVHAPWPSDWNNWSDPNLWVTVGDAGNVADTRYYANGRGAVNYDYKVSRFEVTTGQYCTFLNAVAKTDAHGLYSLNMDIVVNSYGCNIQRSGVSGGYSYNVPAGWANRPVVFVSWDDAVRYANWLTNGRPTTGLQDANTTEDGSYDLTGGTLAVPRKSTAEGGRYYVPSENEWYKAAYYDPNKPGGAGYWLYPTRSDSTPSNYLSASGTNNANFFQGNYTIASPYWRTEAGAFASSPGPYGTYDQGGNAWEWTEGFTGSKGVLRGGSANGDGAVSLEAGYERYEYQTYQNGSIGFRIVEVPEPATVSLLALGGMAMLRRRKLAQN